MRTVVDRKALTGEFDFKLTRMPVGGLSRNPQPDDPPSIFTALAWISTDKNSPKI
jgi:hypothetical protein